LIPFNRYSAYQARSLHTYLGFVHLDDFEYDIWIF